MDGVFGPSILGNRPLRAVVHHVGNARAPILGNELLDDFGRFSPVLKTVRPFSRMDRSPHGVQHMFV
eukprot:6172316-Pleurochrysis_carterae.AAC.3